MMEKFCSVLMVIWLSVGFLYTVHSDFHGRDAKEAKGFSGFIASLIIVGLLGAVMFGSGAFDSLIGR